MMGVSAVVADEGIALPRLRRVLHHRLEENPPIHRTLENRCASSSCRANATRAITAPSPIRQIRRRQQHAVVRRAAKDADVDGAEAEAEVGERNHSPLDEARAEAESKMETKRVPATANRPERH